MSYSEDTIDFLHKGDLIGMHNALSHALKYDSEEMLADLAEYLQMMGFIDESHQVYDKILGDNPSSTDYLINLAEIAEDDGQIDEALNYLYQIPLGDENYVAALIKIADLYQLEGDFETAISKLEEARELSDSPLITFALAESYYEQGAYQEAIQNYAKLSVREILKQTKISTYQRIGESYAQLGNFENALSFLEKSLEFSKTADTIYKIALLYSALDNQTRAISYFKQLEDYNTDLLNYELAYAQALEADRQFEEAARVAQEGLRKNPNSALLLHFLSKLAYSQKDQAAAERYLVDALNVAELHDETVFLLANLYFNMGDFEAVIRLEKLLEEEHLLAQWLFAQANKELENDKQAEALYTELLSTGLRENPDFLKDYVDFLLQLGQNNKAQTYIKQYLELVPEDEELRGLLFE
ncbi:MULTISPECIES: tetratricopeptide repeat protein [Lactococcus]|uniref:tetratricopeptide repeat protein n=1 Tax=Lactococcus TaxID=1357 RepID=UPI0019243CE3|nr:MULTISPECIES: tetratricopeptide repeat protein [Lactococcus]MBL3715338.1 tetratricopeptide repeat protein [Lactococcus garvieae]